MLNGRSIDCVDWNNERVAQPGRIKVPGIVILFSKVIGALTGLFVGLVVG